VKAHLTERKAGLWGRRWTATLTLEWKGRRGQAMVLSSVATGRTREEARRRALRWAEGILLGEVGAAIEQIRRFRGLGGESPHVPG